MHMELANDVIKITVNEGLCCFELEVLSVSYFFFYIDRQLVIKTNTAESGITPTL